MMNFTPLNGNILVEPTDETQTAGGLYIPTEDSQRAKLISGIVIKTSVGRQEPTGLIPCDIKEGERVFYDKSFSSEITMSGEKYHLIDFLALYGKEGI